MSTSESATATEADAASTNGAPLLDLRGVTKRFGAVQALSGISFEVPAGQVTALAGDNGAGKSVTIKTISGLWGPDDGEILWEGKPIHLHGPRDAEALGITTIYQDLALADNLDIVQNMFLGHELVKRGFLDEAPMEIRARETLKELNVRTIRSIRQPVASLSGGQRQSVAVAKAVLSKAKLVIMDEPTAALGVAQTRQVLDLIKRLSSQGVAVLVVSHNLNDVFAVADRVVVLYLGQMVAQGPISDFDTSSVVDYMTTGRSDRARNGGGEQAASSGAQPPPSGQQPARSRQEG
jgi:ABC-type sugar transport system ATPase subunit